MLFRRTERCHSTLCKPVAFIKQKNWNRHISEWDMYNVYHSACWEGSSLLDRAVSTLSNFSWRSSLLASAPRLPHSRRIWNSVRKTSSTSGCSWKPVGKKLTLVPYLEHFIHYEPMWQTNKQNTCTEHFIHFQWQSHMGFLNKYYCMF